MSNGYNKDTVEEAVEAVEALHTELDVERGKYMVKAKAIRERINDAYTIAKQEGVPVKELKAVIKTRELERKAGEQRERLEPDEIERFDLIRDALGDLADLPLGQAALAASP
jgi:uncharacterized protein (UPF0335 family)